VFQHFSVCRKPFRIIWPLILLAAILLAVAAFDTRLKTVYYTLPSSKVDSAIRLVLVSDLHSCLYGEQQQKLLSEIAAAQPDAVLLGGDIADERVPHDNALALAHSLAAQYPCFYVTGNHERWTGDMDALKQQFSDWGITVLEGSHHTFYANGQSIAIAGVDDPAIGSSVFNRQLISAAGAVQSGMFSVLLTHRPEKTDLYEPLGFDLILCGHTHGGQWRLPPFINGLYAPGQGWFPKYSGGRYTFGKSTMIISRGLSTQLEAVPRIFNRPEIVVVDITPEEKKDD